MTAAEWARLKDWFNEAVAAPPESRAGIVARVRGESPDLVRELETLIAAHESQTLYTPDLTARPLPRPELFPQGVPAAAEIGPYRILRELGRGGAGVVFLAERSDDEFHRPVALKLLRYALPKTASPSGLTLERGSLARMQHGNIATLLDWGTSEAGIPWLATEFVAGQPIHEYCRERGLGEDAILVLFDQVAEAVSYAHGRGVVHRDLKPGNILVSADGVVKLVDFGIAHWAEAGPDPAGARRFTPVYASPEQLAGEAASQASDVYSLAVVLGQLLSGTLPVEFSRISAGLAPILRHALESDLRRRYAAVESFRDDLKRYRGHQPPLAFPTPWRRRLVFFARRNRLPLAIGAAGLAALAVFGFLLWYAGPGRKRAPSRPRAALAFGTEAVGRRGEARRLRVEFPRDTAIATVAIVTQGVPNLDFSSADSAGCVGHFAAGQSCSLHIRFRPTASGPRRGAAVFLDDRGQPLDTEYIDGTGTATPPALPSGPPAAILTGLHLVRGLSTDGAGDAFFIETRSGEVDEIPSGASTPVTVTQMPVPNGATVMDGAGNLFLSSSIDAGVFQIIAGVPRKIASLPPDVHPDDNLSADGAGNLYFSDTLGGIYMVAAASHAITQLLPDHPGERFVAMTSDLAGNLYCADYTNNALLELPVGKTNLVVLTGSDGQLSHPHALALDAAGGLLVGNNLPNGHLLRYAPPLWRATPLPILGAQGVALDGAGDLFSVVNDDQVYVYRIPH